MPAWAKAAARVTNDVTYFVIMLLHIVDGHNACIDNADIQLV